MQRRAGYLLAVLLLVSGCGSTSTAHVGNRSPQASASVSSSTSSPSTAASSSTQPPPQQLTGAYGLLIAAGKLQLINADGTIHASVAMKPSSVQYCSSNHDGAVMPPPVSATNDEVYFRDGDTKIKEIVPPSGAVEVTTVPGGTTKVSFFTVSPDDKRIAVLVEDLSAASTISERLYVEDLHGGHHADIFTTTQPKAGTGTTLWPMGWHNGALVLALVIACTFEPGGLRPIEWHVSNAATAARIATVRNTSCAMSIWPSPAGVGCVDFSSGRVTTIYGWDGKVVSVTGPGNTGNDYLLSGLSPAGNSIYFVTGGGIGAPPPHTGLVQLGPGPYSTLQGHEACVWIDEDHLLAPDGVITFPAETPGNVQVTATFTPLAAAGVCAGRFPGQL